MNIIKYLYAFFFFFFLLLGEQAPLTNPWVDFFVMTRHRAPMTSRLQWCTAALKLWSCGFKIPPLGHSKDYGNGTHCKLA